jgi:hypothetical protein
MKGSGECSESHERQACCHLGGHRANAIAECTEQD